MDKSDFSCVDGVARHSGQVLPFKKFAPARRRSGRWVFLSRTIVPIRPLVALAVLLFTGFFGAGCATTKAWEREDLARPEMNPDLHAHRETLRAHVLAIREGSAGGFGQGGGGCGCN